MTWTATLHRDGQPQAEQIPIDDWDLAALVAPLFAVMSGRTVSIGTAVHNHRRETAT